MLSNNSNYRQDTQYACNVTLTRVHETTVAVEEQ